MSRFLDCVVEPDVVARARAGDPAAHENLYRVFGTAVYTLAIRMCRRPDVADEVLQDTFVEVLRKLGDFRGEAPLGAWVRTIAVNKCLMHLRSAWNRYSGPLEPELLDRARPVRDPANGVVAGADLAVALESLSDTSRAVVWLHDVEGYTHKEIAALMGRSTSFSKSQLARAHKRLRALLETTEDEPECMQVLNNC